jgi:hypothetical protein
MENMTTDISELAKGLCRFQGMIPAIPKKKTVKVPHKTGGSHQYSYADLADIWEAIRKPLQESGLAICQVIDENTQGAQLVTILMHSSGQFIKGSIGLSGNLKIQELGSEITYLKRYALSAILGLVTEEDEDGQIANQEPRKTAYKQSAPLGGNTNDHRPAEKAPQTPEMPKKAVPKDSVGKLKYLLLERDMSILRLEEYLLNRSKKSGYTVEQTADAVLQSPDITNKFCEMYSDWIAYVPSGSN